MIAKLTSWATKHHLAATAVGFIVGAVLFANVCVVGVALNSDAVTLFGLVNGVGCGIGAGVCGIALDG